MTIAEPVRPETLGEGYLSLPELFARQAARTPDAPAVRDAAVEVSYREVDERSAAVAEALAERGVRPGDPVGVLGTRSWQSTVALAGVLRAGAVAVPVDSHHPSARMSDMLVQSGAGLVVVLPGHQAVAGTLPVALLPFEQVADRPGNGVSAAEAAARTRRADQAAYILFTSGTTGKPKGVVLPHQAVVRLALDDAPWCAGPGKRGLQTVGLSFDASLLEVWATLLNGGCLVVAGRNELLDPTALNTLMRREQITHGFMPMSLFHHAVRFRPGMFAGLELVLTGGEAMAAGLARAVLEAGPPDCLMNGYGPTEGGIMVTTHDVRALARDATSVPIGLPVARSQCHVMREDGTPASPGEEGELYIGGDGLALGYLGREAETRRAFVTVELGETGSARLYRSGDRARWNEDGTLEYLGRVDRQVKIRGVRIELDALEAQLRTHPDVAEAAVVVRGSDDFTMRLNAFVTSARPEQPVLPEQVSLFLAERLPAHSVPSLLMPVDRLPLTDNGKIDYAALREALPATDQGGQQPDCPPGPGGGSDRDEDPVRRIWSDCLGVPVSDATDFFAAGGNSLLAAHLVNRTLAALGLPADRFQVLLRSLLADRTLAAHQAALADLVRGTGTAAAGAESVDFEAEAALDLDLPAPSGQRSGHGPLRHVLLTGATGFLGGFLLDSLVRHTDAVVHCLVRADDSAHALDRIHANLSRHGLTRPGSGRVKAYAADLEHTGLGLSPDCRQSLADTVDLILHNAAHVNFVYPYSALRDANVGAVRQLVGLASARHIPLHYVSSIAVLAGSGAAGVRCFTETTPLSHPELISMGYSESKWVAERLLQNAAAAGLPVTVHRPYEITGHSRTGAWNTDTALCAFLDAITRLGVAPDIRLPLDMVPVDFVADAIVGLASTYPHVGGVFHLTNPRPALLADMVDRLRAAGHAIEERPFRTWVDLLLDFVHDCPDAPIGPFAPLFATRANQADISIKELFLDSVFPRLDQARTRQIWPQWQQTCPPVDTALLDHYVRCLHRGGVIEAPVA
ncbi:amino acid adenylation domain-containing protein [Streptomyces sp. NPDC020917]|uniref:amino acid adenylation domain-containing protein n=1 Tax=Streptomyces sp. NPDC020917 TaxID=3365102 RepID=UPI003789132D